MTEEAEDRYKMYTYEEFLNTIPKHESPVEEPKEPEPDPETKVDKHCVRVLKVEGAYYRLLKTILITIPCAMLAFLVKIICNIISVAAGILHSILIFIISRINWCIVKSIGRIIFVPAFPVFAGWAFWNLFTFNIHNWLLDNLPPIQTIDGCNFMPASYCLEQGMKATMVPNIPGALFLDLILSIVLLALCFTYSVLLIQIMNSKDPELQVVQKAFQKKE